MQSNLGIGNTQQADVEFKQLLKKAKELVRQIYPEKISSSAAISAREKLKKFTNPKVQRGALEAWVKMLEDRLRPKQPVEKSSTIPRLS